MEKIKVNEEVKEVRNEDVKEVKEMSVQTKLFLEREKFTGNDGKEYWSYFLKGKIRARNIKVDFSPKDKGGYEPLDIIFEVSPKAELIMLEETMTDSITGKRTKYMTYKAQAKDENNIVYECGIKPSRDSDKALLSMMLNQLGGVKELEK